MFNSPGKTNIPTFVPDCSIDFTFCRQTPIEPQGIIPTLYVWKRRASAPSPHEGLFCPTEVRLGAGSEEDESTDDDHELSDAAEKVLDRLMDRLKEKAEK